MSTPDPQVPAISERALKEEFKTLEVDLLSAHCAMHRIKMRKGIGPLARTADPEQMARMLSHLRQIEEFVQEVMRLQ